MTVRVAPLVVAFGILAAVSILLNTQPNAWGLVGVLSIGLGLLALLSPFMFVMNLGMSVFYLDERWLALYLGPRRQSVDLRSVRRVRVARWTQSWLFRDGLKFCFLPEEAAQSEVVRSLLRQALEGNQAVGAGVKISPDVAAVLRLTSPPDGSQNLPRAPDLDLPRPPLRAWPDIRGVSGPLL